MIRYLLTGNISATADSFQFNIMDSKPNVLEDNVFHISWCVLQFEKHKMEVAEHEGIIRVPISRYGNLKQVCKTRQRWLRMRVLSRVPISDYSNLKCV